MYVSMDENLQRPNKDSNFRSADSHSVGVILGKEDINKGCGKALTQTGSCHLYVCLEGPENSYYSIAYTTDNLPFLLRDGQAFYGPLLVRDNAQINLLYHSVSGKPLDIEEYSAFSYVNVFSKLIEGNDVNVNLLKFPTEGDYHKRQAEAATGNVIHYSSEETQPFKDPVSLISVMKSPLSLVNTLNTGTYNTNYWFSIQLTHE
jgi:hypothetical protein